jgi:hypothetical protein
MFGRKDAGDVRGLEEVFRSEEFRRGTENMRRDEVAPPVGPEDMLFAEEFGGPRTVVRLHDPSDFTDSMRTPTGDALPAGWADGAEEPEPRLQADPSNGGASGDADAETPPASWNRRSTRYWTLACVSALAALVAAGIATGSGSSHRPSIAAQGTHGAARQGSGYHTSGPDTTGPTAPGGNGTGATGSGSLSPGVEVAGTHGSSAAPGGHVSLTGAATYTGAPGSPGASSGGSGGGGGRPGSPSPAGGSNPVAPIAPLAPVGSTVGSTVSALGTSVTTAASQVGSSVPAAASTTAAVSNVISTVDQAVSASPL